MEMSVERSMHPDWLSNAYLIADAPGGTAVFVDSGAPLEPLFEAVDRHGLTVTHLLTTHADHDHIAGDAEIQERYGCPIVKGDLETGGLRIEALPTPGHKDDHLAFVFDGELCCTGDVLFKDAVGGGDFGQIKRSVMEVLMQLPKRCASCPGTRMRRRSGASGRRTRSSASGAARSPRAPSLAASAARTRP